AHIDAFLAQPLGGFHLGSDDSLGVAGASSVHTRRIFGRRDEGRDRVHMSGENYRRPRLFRTHCEHVAARSLDWNSFRLKTSPPQLPLQEITDRAFVSSDGFDIHE